MRFLMCRSESEGLSPVRLQCGQLPIRGQCIWCAEWKWETVAVLGGGEFRWVCGCRFIVGSYNYASAPYGKSQTDTKNYDSPYSSTTPYDASAYYTSQPQGTPRQNTSYTDPKTVYGANPSSNPASKAESSLPSYSGYPPPSRPAYGTDYPYAQPRPSSQNPSSLPPAPYMGSQTGFASHPPYRSPYDYPTRLPPSDSGFSNTPYASDPYPPRSQKPRETDYSYPSPSSRKGFSDAPIASRFDIPNTKPQGSDKPFTKRERSQRRAGRSARKRS